MKRETSLTLILSALLASAACWFASQAHAANYDGTTFVHESRVSDAEITAADGKRMLMIGDSITVSNCTAASDGLCGWRKMLAQACGQSDSAYHFDTLSKVGHAAYAAARSIPTSYATIPTPFVSKNRYDAAFVMLGVNDIGPGTPVSGPLASGYTALLAAPPHHDRVHTLSILKALDKDSMNEGDLSVPYEALTQALSAPDADLELINARYTALLEAMQARILPHVTLGALPDSYLRIIHGLRALKIRQIYVISVLPTCQFGQSVRPFASLEIRKANAFLAQAALEAGPGTEIHFLNIYDTMVETQTTPALMGCLRQDVVSGDHLHPKRDDATQSKLTQPIAAKLSAILQNSLGCRAADSLE